VRLDSSLKQMRGVPRGRRLVGCLAVTIMALPLGCVSALAATQPTLGTASSFAVLAGSAVTNTGASTITGDLGLSPGSSVTGFPPGQVNGAQHVDDAVAVQAKTDLTTAYNDAAGQTCDSTLTGDLGGRTLTPGVYCYTSAAQLTGTLTLDGQGNANSVFIFKVGSDLTTASNSRVAMLNGGACGVFWQVGSSATLGTGTAFLGTLMAGASITLNTDANLLPGRALAESGAVTLDSNLVSRPPDSCSSASSSTSTSLTSSPNPSASGSPVTFTAVVTSPGGGTPTGSVGFQDGSTTLGTSPLDSDGQATITTVGLAPGNHTITAVYSGGPGFLAGASMPLTQTVAAPSPSPSASVPPSAAGPASPGPGLPRAGTRHWPAGSSAELATFAGGLAIAIALGGVALLRRRAA
jgi:hypothetical protein